MKLIPCLLTLMQMAAPALCQLHLVVGTPSQHGERSAVAIYRVDEGILRRETLLVAKEIGVDWIGVSYDWRKIVIFPKVPDLYTPSLADAVLVVDFDGSAKLKRCDRPHPSALPGEMWFSDSPARGPSVVWFEDLPDNSGSKRHVYWEAMTLDASIPCARSISEPGGDEIRFAVTSGVGGVFWAPQRDVPIAIDTTGRAFATNATDPQFRTVDLDYVVPVERPKGMESRMSVNDSSALAFTLWNEAGDDYRVIVERKRDHSWTTLPLGGGARPAVRGFGRYIAIAGALSKSPRSQRRTVVLEQRGHGEFGPDLSDLPAQFGMVLTGRLHVYDIETKKLTTIETGQGDSEVLFVDNGTVYWRVVDRLYSAVISEEGLGSWHLLATDDLIRFAHYGFVEF